MNEKNAFSLLSQEIIEKLSEQNISKPSNVQNEVIPLINEGKNLIFQSETGTGNLCRNRYSLRHIVADGTVPGT